MQGGSRCWGSAGCCRGAQAVINQHSGLKWLHCSDLNFYDFVCQCSPGELHRHGATTASGTGSGDHSDQHCHWQQCCQCCHQPASADRVPQVCHWLALPGYNPLVAHWQVCTAARTHGTAPWPGGQPHSVRIKRLRAQHDTCIHSTVTARHAHSVRTKQYSTVHHGERVPCTAAHTGSHAVNTAHCTTMW